MSFPIFRKNLNYKEQAGLLTYAQRLPRLPKADASVTYCGMLTITVTGSSRIYTDFPLNPLLELIPTAKLPEYELIIILLQY